MRMGGRTIGVGRVQLWTVCEPLSQAANQSLAVRTTDDRQQEETCADTIDV
jgi:hypothetical protein